MKKLISVIPVHMFATLLAACGSTTSATSVSILQGLPRIRPNTTATPGAQQREATVEEQVNPIIRLATKVDEPFLWEMLYYAAHMDEDAGVSPESAKTNPDLMKYVKDWGRETDIGSIALEPDCNQLIGAAWIRLLAVDDTTPELAIAVLPQYLGRGIGTLLLQHLLEAAKLRYPRVILSVRSTNPAKRLYERMGFVVTEEIVNRIGTASVSMVINLS